MEHNQTAKQDNGKPIYTHVPVGMIKSAYGIIKYQNDIEDSK